MKHLTQGVAPKLLLLWLLIKIIDLRCCPWERTYPVLNLSSFIHISVCADQPPWACFLILVIDVIHACSRGRGDPKFLGQHWLCIWGLGQPVLWLPCLLWLTVADSRELLLCGVRVHPHLEWEVCGASRWGLKSGNTVYLNWQWFTTHMCRLLRVQPFAKGREVVGGGGAWAMSKGCSVPGSVNTASSVT